MNQWSETRRRLVLAALAGVAWPSALRADSYPSRPIRMIVPWPAGGVSDVVTRRLTAQMESSLGQSIVIENRAGASGQLGAQVVARAAPDGYTLLRGDFVCLVLAPSFAAQPLFDPVKAFQPISMHGRSPMLLVVPPSLGVGTLQEFIELARSKPGQLNYAGLMGATTFVITERFKQAAKIDLRMVSYKGDAPMLTDLVAGHVQAMFAFNNVVIPFIQSGKLKALMVTGEKRVPSLPDVPTVIEAGFPELVFSAWGAFFAPSGTSRNIVDTLNAAVIRALALPEMQKVAHDAGTELIPSTPEECGTFLIDELARWGPVIRATGIRL
jgi:tripartite-type tricarboxylate transporter receptor subunit TctC